MDSEKYIAEVFEKVEKKDVGVSEKSNPETLRFVFEILFTILFAILTLAILGIFELFSTGWDWSIYQSAEFWLRYGILQGASWFARIWIYIIRVKHHERTNKHYQKLKDDMQDFVDADTETPFITEEAELDDFNRKKRAWVNKQKLKVIKISNKYRLTNILEAVKTVDTINFDLNPYRIKTDKTISNITERRLNQKINKVLISITDNWCKTNLDAIKIKYNRVSRTILTNGYVLSRNNDGTPDYKKRGGSTFIRNTMPAFLFISTFMFLIAPLTGDIQNTADAWFRFLTNFILVLASGAIMWYNAHDLFVQTSLKALSERVATVNVYAKKRGIIIKRNGVEKQSEKH